MFKTAKTIAGGIVVVGGGGGGVKDVETFELDGENDLIDMDDYPKEISGAVGGLLHGSFPM